MSCPLITRCLPVHTSAPMPCHKLNSCLQKPIPDSIQMPKREIEMQIPKMRATPSPRSLHAPLYRPSAHHSSTNLLAPTSSPPRNNAAASTFNGESTSGYASSPSRIARTVSKTLYAGVQASLSKSRQISPVSRCILGWTMGVRKRIEGGACGYVGGMVIVRSQRPSIESKRT